MKKNNDKKKGGELLFLGIAILVLVIIVGGVFAYFMLNKKNDEKELAYTDLITYIDEGKVEEIEMTVGSTSMKVKLKDEEEEKTTIVPSTQAFMELINEKKQEGNDIKLIQNKENIFITIGSTLFSLFPTLILVALMIMIIQMQGLGDKGKVYGTDEGQKTDVRFEDVAGLDEEKGELIEIVDFLKKPDKFIEMGAKIPKGILLYGKPGTGKTLIAKAIAGEAGVPFISMSGSEFIEMFAGLGASRVRKLFEKAKKISPCMYL